MSNLANTNLVQLETKAEHVASVLALMGNARRLMILCRLVEGEASVGELAAYVGLGQSALSQHLARLREAGLVATRREAQSIFYSLASAEIRALMTTLYEVYCGPEARPDAGA